MFCRKCGTQFDGNFCPNCGEPSHPENSNPTIINESHDPIHTKKTDNGIISLVLGIVSILTSIMCFGFIPAIIAIVLGNSCIKNDSGNASAAKIGILTGWIGIAIVAFLVLMAMIAAFAE